MIFEDPDELGYFSDHEVMKAARGRGMARVGGGTPFEGIAMTMQDFEDIEAAAINAVEGRDRAAERCRKYAGYGGL